VVELSFRDTSAFLVAVEILQIIRGNRRTKGENKGGGELNKWRIDNGAKKRDERTETERRWEMG